MINGYLVFDIKVNSCYGISAKKAGRLVGYCRDHDLDASIIHGTETYSLRTINDFNYGKIKKRNLVSLKIKDLGSETMEHAMEIRQLLTRSDLDKHFVVQHQH